MSLRAIIGLRDGIVVAIMSASLWLALFAVSFAAESISTFDSQIEIQANGDLLITETIVYDFGTASRHGIYRNLSESHPAPASAWYKERYVAYEIVSVQRDGVSETYTVDKSSDFTIKIGSPTIEIKGSHTYQISYRVAGAIMNSPDGTELYWNVTGSEWSVPMQKVLVFVSVASGAELGTLQACYAGVSGVNTACAEHSQSAKGAYFVQENLQPGQQLTIAQLVSLSQPIVPLERLKLGFLVIPVSIIAFLYVLISGYQWRFKYKSKAPVIAQYEPYENFKPMFTGVLIDARLDSRDISAGIIYLAQQGFIKVHYLENKILFFKHKDYEIELLKPASIVELSSHAELLKMLFDDAELVGVRIKLSEIKKSTSKRRDNVKIIENLKKAVVQDLVAGGFLEQRFPRSAVVGVLVLLFIVIQIAASFLPILLNELSLIMVGLLFTAAVLYFVISAERRTVRGYDAKNYLLGFREFLSVTDKDRFEFHNAPSKSPEQFMEYLPYAIAFGVEKEWAKVFEGIQISNPDWYEGNSAAFSAAAFTESLGSFSTAFAQSSGSSGSSGGGSAGGGGGGGGGGSW